MLHLHGGDSLVLRRSRPYRIESVVKKAKRYGYLPSDFEHVHTTLAECMESKLFNSVLSNPHHVLYHLLPHVKDIDYNLRLRQRCQSHSLTRQKTAT